MQILFSAEHVVNNQMHGISRMMRCVLSGLEDRGHTCVVLADDMDDGDVLLLPANGLVGVKDELHEAIINSSLPIVSVIYDIIPYIFNEHKEQRYEDAIRATLTYSRNIITISHHSAKDLRQHLGYQPHVTVIHPGVPFDPPQQTAQHCYHHDGRAEVISPDDYFLSVGGYGERKGHTELLEAVLETEQQLIMVGVPFYHDQRTQNLAGKAINQGLLIELSGVSDDTLINLYQYAKALVYPTKYEGFGLPIIEAMSCGCPVITTNMTATPEAAGDAALYIEPTTERIVWAMERVSRFRYSLTGRGWEQVKKFHWPGIAVDYEHALRV